MAEFDLNLQVEVNPVTYLVTVTDTSNWDDNDENYDVTDFVRTLVVEDVEEEELFSSPYTIGVSNEITFTPDKDRFVKIIFTAFDDANDITITKEFTYLFNNDLIKCYINKVNEDENCGCASNGKKCSLIRRISNAMNAATYNFRYSNFIKAQEHLDYGNSICGDDCNCN